MYMYMYCAYFCYMCMCMHAVFVYYTHIISMYMYISCKCMYNVGFIPATRASATKRGGEQSANSDKTAQRYSQQ